MARSNRKKIARFFLSISYLFKQKNKTLSKSKYFKKTHHTKNKILNTKMDILDPLQKLLDITMALKELVDIFKGKDKWFETCYTYLGSVIETITKYKENRNPKKKIPDACILLQGELDSFKDLLENEKKRSSFSSFFRGRTMVREAQDQLAAIEKQIHNFNLALSVDNQIETNDNFRKLVSCGPGSFSASFKNKFINKSAADMWMSYFYEEEQVSWSAFTFALKKFAFESDKIEMTEIQLNIVILRLDEDNDRLIRFIEWDNFFGKTWSKENERNYLLSQPPIIPEIKSSIVVPPLVLKVAKINANDPKQFIYPLKHEIMISEEKVIFQDYEGKEITIKKNWEREALLFGRFKPQIFKPDVYYHNKVISLSDKQFQINLKKLLNSQGFFLNNLSTSFPTSLKIENIPYTVEPDMIFDLADTLILVETCIPACNVNLDEDSHNYFYVSLNNQLDDTSGNNITEKSSQSKSKNKKKEEEAKKKGKNKTVGDVVMPSITLKIIQGADQKNQAIEFSAKKKNEEKVVKIGSDEKCDFVIKELEKMHMKFRYDLMLKSWVAERDEECTTELYDGNAGTYLYLIKGKEFSASDSKPKTGKLSVKLRDGMKIAFNFNELEVKML